MLVCGGREAMVMAPPLCVTQQYSLAFLAARLSSKGISHHNILPHIPSTSFCGQQQPSSGDYSTVPKLQLPATTLFGVCIAAARTIWFSFHLGMPQISSFALSLKYFSSNSDNCPDVGIGPLLLFLHLPRAGPVLLTLLFFPLVPSSYRVLHGPIYSFPPVRSSCPLSAGVLHVLLCLKVYFWCIHGETCTPHPPTPLSSYSPKLIFKNCISVSVHWWKLLYLLV